MQIVIDIPGEDVPNKQGIIDISLHFVDGEVCECTYPYIVLPKGHGRLIDANELLDRIGLEDNDSNREENVGEIITLEDFDFISTIIEADGGDVG